MNVVGIHNVCTSLTKCLYLSDKPPIQRFPVEGAALAPLPWLTHHCGFFSLLTSGGNLVDQILTNHLHYELVVFFNWVVGCLSPILTQWKAEGDSKVLKSKLVSVATPTSPHYWLVGRSGGSGHARAHLRNVLTQHNLGHVWWILKWLNKIS